MAQKFSQKIYYIYIFFKDILYNMYIYIYICIISSLFPEWLLASAEKDVMADKVVTGCWACGKHGFPVTLGFPTTGEKMEGSIHGGPQNG